MNKISEIRKTINEMSRISKLLKEAYVYDEEDREMPRGYEDEMGGEAPMEDEEDMEAYNHETDDIIDKIRMLALDGIQKYSEDVDNEMYVTYKKIWMMCDKCLSEKDKVEN